jgi:two-component system LytT family response regulator
MRKVKTIVVDDEPLARARIVKLLEQFDYIQLLGECKNGREALDAIANYQPDLVFLDIQMPDLNGFDVLSDESLQPLPFIIFVTAYDQYALKAFDVQAVDYLLKPYDEDRFTRAVEHAKQQIQLKNDASLHHKMIQIIEAHQHSEQAFLYTISYKEKGIDKTIRTPDVYYFETDGNYLRVHTKDKKPIIRQTMQAIADQLDPKQFLRIHRSLLVNVNYIRKVSYEGNNQFIFSMKNGDTLTSSRGYKEVIQEYLNTPN